MSQSAEPTAPRLILASRSPRRSALLSEAGYVFDILPADVDETDYPPDIMPGELAVRLARQKSHAIALLRPEDCVLGADTVVAFGDRILGKPDDAEHARQMLTLLAGTTHIVITGVSVVCRPRNFSQERRVMSAVHMRPMSDEEIARYVASGAWQGKAGGYGIQDADPFVTRMSGSQSNVVGLPMTATRRMLSAAGIVPDKAE